MHLVRTKHPDENARMQITNRQLRFELARLVSISEKMLEHATHRQWQQVEALELERKAILTDVSELASVDELSPEITSAYRAVIANNEEISQLLESDRSSLLEEFKKDRQKVVALRQYRKA